MWGGGDIAINLMDPKKIKQKRERERMRDFGTYQPSVYYWQLHIVLESCLISFTQSQKKNTKQQQKQIFFHPNGRREREREREREKPIAPPRMMMMCQISEGFGFFPCGPT